MGNKESEKHPEHIPGKCAFILNSKVGSRRTTVFPKTLALPRPPRGCIYPKRGKRGKETRTLKRRQKKRESLIFPSAIPPLIHAPFNFYLLFVTKLRERGLLVAYRLCFFLPSFFEIQEESQRGCLYKPSMCARVFSSFLS